MTTRVGRVEIRRQHHRRVVTTRAEPGSSSAADRPDPDRGRRVRGEGCARRSEGRVGDGVQDVRQAHLRFPILCRIRQEGSCVSGGQTTSSAPRVPAPVPAGTPARKPAAAPHGTEFPVWLRNRVSRQRGRSPGSARSARSRWAVRAGQHPRAASTATPPAEAAATGVQAPVSVMLRSLGTRHAPLPRSRRREARLGYPHVRWTSEREGRRGTLRRGCARVRQPAGLRRRGRSLPRRQPQVASGAVQRRRGRREDHVRRRRRGVRALRSAPRFPGRPRLAG